MNGPRGVHRMLVSLLDLGGQATLEQLPSLVRSAPQESDSSPA